MSSRMKPSRSKTSSRPPARRSARATPHQPTAVVAHSAAATPDDWDAWTAWLANRLEPRAVTTFWDSTGMQWPLLWATHSDLIPETTRDLVRLLQFARESRMRTPGRLAESLEPWLEQAETAHPTPAHAVECLAWCHALPGLAGCLPAAPWSQLLDQLLSIAAESVALSLEQHPLAAPLLSGELPLTLAYLFPELRYCRDLWGPAARRLSTGIVELLDAEGLPRGHQLWISRTLLACWTRCHSLAAAADRAVFDAKACDQYNSFVRQLLRMTRADGSAVFSPGANDRWPDDLIRTALGYVREPVSQAVAARVLDQRRRSPSVSDRELPELSVQSEWSETAVLRRDWTRCSPQFVLTYANQAVRCELSANCQTLWSGAWELAVTVDQRPLRAASDWEQVCWASDEDGDYLELQIHLEENCLVQRHIYLARADNFLLLADAFLGRSRGEIEYRGSLPLAPGVSFLPETATWEGVLSGRRHMARVMPLALPEWRTGARHGSLQQSQQYLHWQQRRTGQRLFVPLFWDLEPRRLARPITWRQLTVAQRLVVQEADDAVGFRVQVGGRHWLVYRSLGARGNRTVLGQNFSTEFVLARIQKDAEAEKLIEIE